MRVLVQEQAFDQGAELNAFSAGREKIGAVVTFSGIVRGDDGLSSLRIEHYPGMTQKALADIAAQAKARWDLADVLVIHRFGTLGVGETIMMVATAAAHRRAAFEAADFLMDYLKSRAPFWKQEFRGGKATWVSGK